jgi:hypothetical protein
MAKSNRILWKLVSAGTLALSAKVAEKLTNKSWKAVTHKNPPKHPEAPGVSWKRAIAWTLVSASIAGVVAIATKKGIAKGYQKVTGEFPPV